MDTKHRHPEDGARVPGKPSPVKVLISWLIETDREYRAIQSIINERKDRP